MNETLINNLKYLGFNVYEAKIYIELLKQTHPLTAYEIARISGVPRSKVYEVVDKLFLKHALVQTENGAKKYLAVDSDEGHGICTKNVYMNNILQDNIVHEIYLGILEEKLGIEYIQEITERVPDRLWGRAMMIFKDYFRL